MSIQEFLNTQQTIQDMLNKRMSEFESRQQKLTQAPSPDITALSEEFSTFKSTVLTLLQLLHNQVQVLLIKCDDLEAHNRRKVLLFGGVKEQDGEQLEARVLGIINGTMLMKDITASSIRHCHRLGKPNDKRPRPILVRFTCCSSKVAVWKNKTKLKSSAIVLSEFLTRTRQEVFSRVRKHFGVTSCWTRDGAVFVKLPSGESSRVDTMAQAEETEAQFPQHRPQQAASSPRDTPPNSRAVGSKATAPQVPTTRKATGVMKKRNGSSSTKHL